MTDITYTGTHDYVGLSTETKPTTNVVDGSTLTEVDTKKAYIFYNGSWYEQ